VDQPGRRLRRWIIATLIDILLLVFLAAVAFATIRIRNLFAATMLMGIFSLLAASLYVLLDAVDVALTEAAVGAGVSIILMLGALVLTSSKEKVHDKGHNLLALVVVLITGAALIYGTLDMPHFADPEAPAHLHVSPRYVQDSVTEIGIPNMVTSVLASYRGLDTLGEVLVIFAAGVAVLLVLGAGAVRTRRKGQRP
jgi:multicomponent Na+:H+ antiporter subunit B